MIARPNRSVKLLWFSCVYTSMSNRIHSDEPLPAGVADWLAATPVPSREEAKPEPWTPEQTPLMFTQESLLEIGTPEALNCAVWMEQNGKTELAYVGPFGEPEKVFRKGVKVRIRKGAHIKNLSKGDYVAGRSYVVTIHDLYRGWAAGHDAELFGHTMGKPVRMPELVWPGTGGYWSYVSPNDVEVVP